MFKQIILIALVVAGAAALQEEAAPEPYSFQYDADSHSAAESKDANGKVTGYYTIAEADGRQRRVDYEADAAGFRAKVQTNEVGTKSDNSADVEVLASPPTREQLVQQVSGAQQYSQQQQQFAQRVAGQQQVQRAYSQQVSAAAPLQRAVYGSYQSTASAVPAQSSYSSYQSTASAAPAQSAYGSYQSTASAVPAQSSYGSYQSTASAVPAQSSYGSYQSTASATAVPAQSSYGSYQSTASAVPAQAAYGSYQSTAGAVPVQAAYGSYQSTATAVPAQSSYGSYQATATAVPASAQYASSVYGYYPVSSGAYDTAYTLGNANNNAAYYAYSVNPGYAANYKTVAYTNEAAVPIQAAAVPATIQYTIKKVQTSAVPVVPVVSVAPVATTSTSRNLYRTVTGYQAAAVPVSVGQYSSGYQIAVPQQQTASYQYVQPATTTGSSYYSSSSSSKVEQPQQVTSSLVYN